MVEETFLSAFPRELRLQAGPAISALKLSADYDYGLFQVNVLGETLHIPRRVLSPSIKPDLSELTPRQRQIALCMLTRSTDGYERHAALREVLQIDEPWSIPFVIALVGEYVIEIIDDIHAALPGLKREVVAAFIRENPAFYKLTCGRVTSYWNCYYRGQHQRSEYVGFKLLRELDALASP